MICNDEKSLSEKRKCICPGCNVVHTKIFEYGCSDKMPRGGLPKYYCKQCEYIINTHNIEDPAIFSYNSKISKYRNSKENSSLYF